MIDATHAAATSAVARHTLNCVGEAGFDILVVATCDKRLARLAVDAGAVVALERDSDDLNQAIALGIRAAVRSQADLIAVVPADLPLLKSDHLRDALRRFEAFAAARAATPSSRRPAPNSRRAAPGCGEQAP